MVIFCCYKVSVRVVLVIVFFIDRSVCSSFLLILRYTLLIRTREIKGDYSIQEIADHNIAMVFNHSVLYLAAPFRRS